MVESYWIELKCYKNLDTTYEVRLNIKKSDNLAKLLKILYERFDVLETQASRLWTTTVDGNLISLNLTDTADEIGLYSSQIVLLEVQVDRCWMSKNVIFDHLCKLNDLFSKRKESLSESGIIKLPSCKQELDGSVGCFDKITDSQMENEDTISSSLKTITLSSDSGSLRQRVGLCGLMNLGNTCYMNSVLQCLSNCPPLTDYFLQSRHTYELNKRNPLGMAGELAKSYGDLIQNMWSGESTTLRPFLLKTKICRFNPQFQGWAQHDAQEFLSFLLDGLHEDLNRVLKKNLILDKEFKDGLSTNDKGPWQQYKANNDSVVVDIFHGLLKSRVICPKCEQLSVTFDPFSTLSLPLPLQKNKLIKVIFIPNDPSKTTSSFEIGFPQKGLFKDLLSAVSYKTNSNERRLIPAEVTDYHIERIYTSNEKISALRDNDQVYIYELSEKANDPEYSTVPVCFWNIGSPTEHVSLKHGFGIPLLLIFLKKDLSDGKVGRCIVQHIKQRFDIKSSFLPNMFVLDLSSKRFADSIKMEFSRNGDCKNDIVELLGLKNPEIIFVRKMLLVDVPLTGKESFFEGFSSNTPMTSKSPRKSENHKLEIYDCLYMFTSFEKLGSDNEWYCPKCRSHQRATKKFDIWRMPRVLVLHLKRFSYSSLGDKLETPIDFPVRGLDMSTFVTDPAEKKVSYDLVGVVNHYGTLSGGHYTASCRNAKSGSWFQFNDDFVSAIETSRVPSPAAYVLFYLRSDSG